MSKRKVDEIEQDIRKNYPMMLNLKEAGEVLGYTNRDAVRRFLAGVPYVDMGKEKKYLAKDIAQRISAQMINL